MMGIAHTCTIKRKYRQKNLSFTAGTGTAAAGQTVTGGTSHATAVIVAIATGSLRVQDLTGTFTAGETLTTTTWSGTFGTSTDAAKTGGGYYFYWAIDQSDVACRFYEGGGGKGVVILMAGGTVLQPLKCMLPATVNIRKDTASEYLITTIETQHAGTYSLSKFYPRTGAANTNHFEAELTREEISV
jgi:hypothetical protein